MREIDSIYHRTGRGDWSAHCACAHAVEDRALLRCVGQATHFDFIAAMHSHEPRETLAARLERLEALGFVESVAVDWLVALIQPDAYEPRPAPVQCTGTCS
jgi:hypothetical protein